MDPVVKGAVAVALMAATSVFAERRAPPAGASLVAAPGAPGVAMPCGPRTVPDGTSCVPIPDLDASLAGGAQPEEARGAHPARGRGMVVYDHLPRLPDRPEAFSAYRYPVEVSGDEVEILSGYDLGLDPNDQRHGHDHQVGHGALDIAASRGVPVVAIDLEGQQGPTEVLYVGPLFGTTVVTSHTLKQAQRLRIYLVFHGHLEAAAPGLAAGAKLTGGDLLGRVGDTGSPGNVHLHLEVRQARPDVTIGELAAARWIDQAVSIPCDPRNVLPLR